MGWLKNKFLKICAILIFESASSIYCLHVVPTSYPCCDNIGSISNFGTGVISTPVYPLNLDSETDPFKSGQKAFGLVMPPPFAPDDDTSAGYQTKAYSCSLIPCLEEETTGTVCACNFNTGNVVTFKNSCDVKKHNCRFNTAFKVILNEICPWEFESRRSNKIFEVNYNDPKYYNK
ncbi:uncharacterized protein LOC120633821 [Pararge aegeria]|uniref:uncharacterized protein LOC120633821 n=1 Tax=Pararge aegeria TaxID=116150 RepID=UPI0019D1B9A5|nr:uncharacterized protein LOC120633821 [Pararge aegeria]